MSLEANKCSNCTVECDKLFSGAGDMMESWAGTMENYLIAVDRRLDSASALRQYVAERLRLPLHEIHCSEWDNTEFVERKIMEAAGEK